MRQHWDLFASKHASSVDALEIFSALILTSPYSLASRLDACLSLFLFEGSSYLMLEDVMIAVSVSLQSLSKACAVEPPSMQERMQIALHLYTQALQLSQSHISGANKLDQ